MYYYYFFIIIIFFDISIELPSHFGVTSVEAGANLQGGFNVLCNSVTVTSHVILVYMNTFCSQILSSEVVLLCSSELPTKGGHCNLCTYDPRSWLPRSFLPYHSCVLNLILN